MVIVLAGREHSVHYQAGRDVPRDRAPRRTARAVLVRGGQLRDVHGVGRDGEATMRVNNALTPEEVAEGWVLTCQGFPASSSVTVVYES